MPAVPPAKVLTAFACTLHVNHKDIPTRPCVPMPIPTAYPMILTKVGHTLLPRIVAGIRYARAGIMVTDLGPRRQPSTPGDCSQTFTKNSTSGPS